jgi:hypothetical protein
VPKPIYKLLIFLKRRPGMSLEEFRAYYEGSHAPLCEKYVVGACRYVRRYVTPLPADGDDQAPEMDFDVITETWFEDKALFDQVVQHAPRAALPPEVLADEERLFDRSRTRYAAVTEYDTEAVAGAVT